MFWNEHNKSYRISMDRQNTQFSLNARPKHYKLYITQDWQWSNNNSITSNNYVFYFSKLFSALFTAIKSPVIFLKNALNITIILIFIINIKFWKLKWLRVYMKKFSVVRCYGCKTQMMSDNFWDSNNGNDYHEWIKTKVLFFF